MQAMGHPSKMVKMQAVRRLGAMEKHFSGAWRTFIVRLRKLDFPMAAWSAPVVSFRHAAATIGDNDSF
jgi:hypothetical protein